MKKLLFICLCTLAAFGVSAQGEFSGGIHLGLPLGDAGDFYTFQFGVDANYLWNVADGIDAGVATGYMHGLLDGDFEGDDIQFIPIAAAGRYNITEEFNVGADLGYAIGLNDGNDGGFYYRPRVGYDVTELIELNLSYQGVSIDGPIDYNTIVLGALYHFGR